MPFKDPEKKKNYHRDYLRRWSKTNPRRMAKYAREFKQKIRLEVLKLLGGKCVNCGLTDIRVLQVDHIKPVGQKNRLQQLELKKDILKNSTNYQLLCANCNWIKRYDNNETNIKYL